MNTTENMTTRIAHDNLAAAVGAAVKFCPGARCQKPVLRTVLVRCDDDGTTATATDFDLRIVVRLDGGIGRGVALVPAEAAKMMQKASGGFVEFTDTTVIAGGITAPMDDPMEYPCHSLLQLPAAASLRFDHVEMIAAAVAPATDNESSRFALGGIHLEDEAGRIVAVGTDGRRLHAIDAPSISEIDGPLDVVALPGTFGGFVRAVRSVAREVLGIGGRRLAAALAASTVEVRHSSCDGCVELRWSCDGATVAVQGRVIEGKFPRWRDVLPAGCMDGTGSIALPAKAGTVQLKAARRVVTEVAKGVLFKDGQITAGVEWSGTFTAPVAGTMTGPAVKLDPSFLLDALAAVESVGGTVATFNVHDGQSAVRLESCGGHGNDARLRVVIMPLAAD
jgi:DNA polymerase-3 subunit beta